jgi:hypothetical protein
VRFSFCAITLRSDCWACFTKYCQNYYPIQLNNNQSKSKMSKPAKLRLSPALVNQLKTHTEKPVIHSLEPPSELRPKQVVGRAYGGVSHFATPRLVAQSSRTNSSEGTDDDQWDPSAPRLPSTQPRPSGPPPMDLVSAETKVDHPKPVMKRAPSTAVRGGRGSFRERIRIGGEVVMLMNDRVDNVAATEIAEAIREQVFIISFHFPSPHICQIAFPECLIIR